MNAKAMGKHGKTITIVETADSILTVHNPMTVRQVYYQVVSRPVAKSPTSGKADQLVFSQFIWGAFPLFSQKGLGKVWAQETAFPKFQKCLGHERENILKS